MGQGDGNGDGDAAKVGGKGKGARCVGIRLGFTGLLS